MGKRRRQEIKHQRRGEVVLPPTLPSVLIHDYSNIKSKITAQDHLLLSKAIKVRWVCSELSAWIKFNKLELNRVNRRWIGP